MTESIEKGGRKPLISVSIPVLDEEETIPALYGRLDALAVKMQEKCDLEFVFSDNHSTDGTWALLTELASKDSRVRAVRFFRNVGFQRSILANYLHTRGDAVMQIDADLQDPPEMLEDFYALWEQGYQVVYGIRKKRPEGWMINSFRRLGYWVIDKFSGYPIPRDVGDFRLIDRKVIETLSGIRAPNPYLRGMIASLGFKHTGIPYERSPRLASKSKINLFQLIRLGITAIFDHSAVPLRIASFMGGAMLALSVVGAFVVLIYRLRHPGLPQGFASTFLLIVFSIGLNSFLLGIIGEYILRIFLILRSEPLAIVEQSLNTPRSELKL